MLVGRTMVGAVVIVPLVNGFALPTAALPMRQDTGTMAVPPGETIAATAQARQSQRP